MPPQPYGQQQKGTKLDRFFSCQDTKPQYRRLQQSGHYAWQRRHQGDCTSSTFWILEVRVSFDDGGLCRSGEAPLLHTTREWRPLPCHHTGIGSLWLYALSVGSWTDGRAYLPMFGRQAFSLRDAICHIDENNHYKHCKTLAMRWEANDG